MELYFARRHVCHRNQMRRFSCDTLLRCTLKQTFLVLSNFFEPHFSLRRGVNWQHMQFVTAHIFNFFTCAQFPLLPSRSGFMQGQLIWISLMVRFPQMRKKYSRAMYKSRVATSSFSASITLLFQKEFQLFF